VVLAVVFCVPADDMPHRPELVTVFAVGFQVRECVEQWIRAHGFHYPAADHIRPSDHAPFGIAVVADAGGFAIVAASVD
jgi:hypothetical protein